MEWEKLKTCSFCTGKLYEICPGGRIFGWISDLLSKFCIRKPKKIQYHLNISGYLRLSRTPMERSFAPFKLNLWRMAATSSETLTPQSQGEVKKYFAAPAILNDIKIGQICYNKQISALNPSISLLCVVCIKNWLPPASRSAVLVSKQPTTRPPG